MTATGPSALGVWLHAPWERERNLEVFSRAANAGAEPAGLRGGGPIPAPWHCSSSHSIPVWKCSRCGCAPAALLSSYPVGSRGLECSGKPVCELQCPWAAGDIPQWTLPAHLCLVSPGHRLIFHSELGRGIHSSASVH